MASFLAAGMQTAHRQCWVDRKSTKFLATEFATNDYKGVMPIEIEGSAMGDGVCLLSAILYTADGQ
jgi:hypothetical protein